MVTAGGKKSKTCARFKTERVLRGMVASVRAFEAARFGDMQDTIALTRRALRQLPVLNLVWRLNAQMALANAYEWAGEVRAATEAFERVI